MTKRLQLTGITLATALSAAFAVPADPTPHRLTQPDGTVITVRICGDEYEHALIDEKGRIVEYDPSTGFFRETSSVKKGMPRRKSMQHKTFGSGPAKLRTNTFPTLGKQKALVVLLEFSDQPFISVENPRDFYTRMLNEEGFTHSNGANGSARDFYLASSDGKFDPTFTVTGPVKLSHEAKWYGADDGKQDARMGLAVKEACEAIDSEVNLADYDADGDGVVDNIFFFYSGYGQADYPEGTDYIWPHSGNMEESWDISLSLDGKKIGNYACSNEVRYSAAGDIVSTGIGTFVHEFGHVLGLPDLYDVSHNILTFGLGSWDTMARGSYNNNMNTPPLFSGFERAELGWLDYTDMPEKTLTDIPWIGNGEATAVRIKVPGHDNEWFVLENRQKTGWDTYIPGHGLLIWHIDMQPVRWDQNSVNTDAYHQLVDIIEVDGNLSDGTRDSDTMPGTAGITGYTLKAWDGSEVFGIDDVTEEGEDPAQRVVRVLPVESDLTLAAPEKIDVSDITDSGFSFTWSEVKDAAYYLVSIDGKEAQRYENRELVAVTGLKPEVLYEISVKAGRGSVTGAAAKHKVTTAPLAFEKRRVENVTLTAKGRGLEVSWNPLRDAEKYEVAISRLEREETSRRMGYGFDNKSDGMPGSWLSSSNSYISTSGYYGESAPSLRMTKDGDYLEIYYPETILDELSFWYADNGSGNTFSVEIPSDTGWTDKENFSAEKGGQTATVSLDRADKVRIVLKRNGGYAMIDDVYVGGRSLLRTSIGKEFTELTTHMFKNLEEGTYGVIVNAVKGDVRSLPSVEAQIVMNSSGIIDIPTSDKTPAFYINIHGIRTSEPSVGFNIVVYTDGSTSKRIIK